MATSNRAFLVTLLLTLATASPVSGGPAPWPGDNDPRYVYAVSSSSVSSNTVTLPQSDVVTNLTTIENHNHIRNDSDQILMTMFTSYMSSGTLGYSRGWVDTVPSVGYPLWVTVAPELRDYLTANNVTGSTASQRIKQLLGLPATHTGFYVVEFWTDEANLFRPAMNPDITNSTTSTTFQGEMAVEGSVLRNWYNANCATTYDPTKGTPYPWVRAGYTYDWGNPTSKVGLSEFIFNGGTDPQNLTVRAVIAVNSYSYYDRNTESFDVTNSCDSIWTGSSYLPNTIGAASIVNSVTIRSGVTISGGDGIVVTDLSGGGTATSNVFIKNDGTILGSGTRSSSVYFTNTGGTVTNTGTITGDAVGILGGTTTRPIVVNNSGVIRGATYAIFTSNGDDVITSSGLLDGHVNTDAGNDTVNILGGAITGSIDGGAGTNTMNFILGSGGTFTFNNDISDFSTIGIHSGTVRLNGAVGGSVTVDAGATLGGNAAITGSLSNDGMVSPGNSIGTISAAGYSQSSGAVLEIQMAKSANGVLTNDLLDITGAATLANGSIIHVIPDIANSGRVFGNGDTFQFITAGGGLTDNGSQLVLDSQFLGLVGTVGAGSESFTLYRTAAFASAAAPGNNRSMAAALDGDTTAAVGGYAVLINELLFTDTATFNSQLQRYSPAAHLDVSAASNRTAQYMAESISGYLRTRRMGRQSWSGSETSATQHQGAPAFADVGDSPTELAEIIKYCSYEDAGGVRSRGYNSDYSAWANPFGVFYGERSDGDHLGFQSNVAGSQFGVDRQVSEHCIFGVGLGYDQMHLATNDLYSSGETETFRVGPYATWFNDAGYLDASITGGFHDNSLGRSVSVGDDVYVAHSRYNAADLSMYLGGGRDYRVGASVITPQASLQYIIYRQDDFVETGAEGADLAVDPLDAYSLRSRIGGQFTREFQYQRLKVLSEAFGGWAHEYLANDVLEARFLGGVTRFSTDRGGIFRDSGYYGVSLTAMPGNHVSLFTRYSGEYAVGGHYAAIDAGLTFEF